MYLLNPFFVLWMLLLLASTVYDAKWVELQKECWEIDARYLWFISDEMKRNRLNIFTRNAEHVALTSL